MKSFTYDAARANGADERAVLATLIDKKLAQFRRGQRRYANHRARYGDLRPADQSEEGRALARGSDSDTPLDAAAVEHRPVEHHTVLRGDRMRRLPDRKLFGWLCIAGRNDEKKPGGQ